jgi:ABC-type polysaccharide/polyol phosphate export permease
MISNQLSFSASINAIL